MRFKANALTLVFLLSLAAGALAEGVKINRESPAVEHRKFDRNNPPADMPPLEPPEAAVTKAVFGVATQFAIQVVSEQNRGGKTVAKVKVTEVTLDLSLKITIWVPSDAAKVIIDHEEGHRQISEYFYEDAEKIARNLAQKYAGKVYEAQGNDAEAAGRAALDKVIEELSQKYMSETQNLAVKANVIYDKITEHSRNQKISVDKAVKQSIERAKKDKEKK
jgi:hypothetical protein